MQNYDYFLELTLYIQMGTTISQTHQNVLLDDLLQIGQQDNMKILQNRQTQDTFAFKEDNFTKQDKYEIAFKNLANRKQGECQNIIQMVKLWSKEHTGLCSSTYKIFRVYEYPKVKLIDQIEARKVKQLYFQQFQLFCILQSCLNARLFEPRYSNISPHLIFIFPEGTVKLLHLDLVDPNHRFCYNPNYYYSPQKMQDFTNPNLESSQQFQAQAVFSFGMTLLHSSLLQNLQQCYQLQSRQLNKKKLAIKMSTLQQMNYPALVHLISRMLAIAPQNRINFNQIQQFVNLYFQNNLSQSQSEQNSEHVSNNNSFNGPNMSLMYSGDTILRPSVPLSVSTVHRKQPASQLKLLLQQSKRDSISTLPKKHFILSRSKGKGMNQSKSKGTNQYQKQNESRTIGMNSRNTQDERYVMTQSQGQNLNRYISQSKKLLCSEQLKISNKQQSFYIVQSYADGSHYQGWMQGGLKNGYGKMIFTDGAYYQGNYKDGKMQGQGALYYRISQPAYIGEWKNNMFNGYGKLFNQKPASLLGNYNYSDFNRIGDYWVKFQGNFIEDMKQGPGKIYLSNGETMEGNFQMGCLQGQSIFTSLEGNTITGLWLNNILTYK